MTTLLPNLNNDPANGRQRQELREASAALVRYMMRAYLKVQSAAFSIEQLARWSLNDFQADAYSARHLLRSAYNTVLEINTKFLQRCGSGGLRVDTDDSDRELKEKIAFFVDYEWTLPDAIRSYFTGEKVDWKSLAAWGDIDRIRELLDAIPQTIREPDIAKELDAPEIEQTIILRGLEEQPTVLGTLVPVISETQYHIVRTLLEAAPGRLTGTVIAQRFARDRITAADDLGKAIRNLAASHENWKAILTLPGRGSHHGYGVRITPP